MCVCLSFIKGYLLTHLLGLKFEYSPSLLLMETDNESDSPRSYEAGKFPSVGESYVRVRFIVLPLSFCNRVYTVRLYV